MLAMTNKFEIKRIYEPPSPDDGFRILVDRLWPRGLQKSEAKVDEWFKEVAPSPGLRKWFNHDPEKWPEFTWKYTEELKHNHAVADLTEALKSHSKSTLLYGARDTEHNHVIVLKDFLKTKN